jgi:hypothetical protein
MNDRVDLLRHFLATLAYRTQKSLHDAPAGFDAFSPGEGVRTPLEIVHHMASLLAYSVSALRGTQPVPPDPPLALAVEVERFHAMLEQLSEELGRSSLREERLAERLLQGPLADAMTHAGQLTMLRRLAGAPIARENYFRAAIDPANLGANQPFSTA